MSLSVPLVTPDDDTLTAAFRYAAAGWYVLPVRADDRKNPGSRVGQGWQHQSSRDSDQLAGWFAGSSDVLALHVGRSGAVVFDVDDPDRVPELLAAHLHGPLCPPHQSSRPAQPGRGHYVFAQPPGRMIGNSTGRLCKGWGEVRGKNGVIIVAPSRHAREADGARYEWLQTGGAPRLPVELAERLPDAGETNDAATDEEVRRFIAGHTTARVPGKLRGPLTKYSALLKGGGSRHESLIPVACWAMREVVAGLYAAEAAVTELRAAFVTAMATHRTDTDRVLAPAAAEAEADGVLAWAIAQAESEIPEIGTQNPQNSAPGDFIASSEGFEGVSPEEWDSPTPLPVTPAPIPTDALGPVLGCVVEAVSAALQVPTDLPINLALPIITTAAAGGWTAEVEPGWTEPLCLDTLSALPSGERKSPTLKVLDAPLRRFEQQAQQDARPRRAEQLAKKKLAEDQVAETRKAAVKGIQGEDSGKERAYLDAVGKHDAIEIAPLPRCLADDATPEAVVSLLADHGSIGVISAEPGLFGILAGRYSSGAPNIEWFLKATSGEAIKVDRMGRDPQDVPNPALSMAACIQPGRLVELGRVKAFRESGLLARLLYVVPRSDVGSRGRTTRVPVDVAALWDGRLTALAAAARKRREAGGEPDTLPLDDDGRDALDAFRAEIEPHLHPDHGRYAGIADWCNKLPGAVVRIAAALTLIDDPDACEVTGAVVRDAVRIGRAYIGHAIAAFGLTRPNGEVYSQARQVLATVRRLCLDASTDSVSRRAVHQKLRDRAWVETGESLDTPIGLLVEYGHVRPVVVQPDGGGRPSIHLKLHPDRLADQENQT